MLNRTILIGRLTRDPELRYTTSGIPMAFFSLAVERPFTNKEGEKETDFIDIKVWRKLAEVASKNLGKGRLIAVDGRLEQQRWETEDGQKRSKVVVVAESVKFLDYPKDKKDSSNRSNNDLPADDDMFGSDPFGGMDLPDDDIPF